MELLFWSCLGLVAHSYFLYPLLVLAAERLLPARPLPRLSSEADLPAVAVVVAACNEERHIDDRIRNLLAHDYPAHLLTVYIGSDGSTDRTAQIAQSYASERVRVFAFEKRRGKASVLNDLLTRVEQDIVVFTDANTFFEDEAIRALVANFADPQVGAVNGELRLFKAGQGDNADGAYWRIETALKQGESRLGGVLGANGGIYAIRHGLYRPLPGDTIIDDFTVAMTVAALGWRTVFEPRAVAREQVPPGIDDEFRRRVRIGTGNYQALFRHPEYWTRAGWGRRFGYLSHKVLRWFTPHLLVLALAANLALMDQPFYRALLWLQVAGYGIAALGMLLRRHISLVGPLRLPLLVFALNLAFLLGFWRYISGGASGLWQRTER
jgi:cellulose synthase/poly-beta-1,6-N-acetylglucosamine synthase-like glycosyltransferase